MKKIIRLALLPGIFTAAILFVGCSNSRKIDYELQEKCAKDAAAMFKADFADNPLYPGADYEDHYSKKLNKCFMLLTAMLPSTDFKNPVIQKYLFDVNENHLCATADYRSSSGLYSWTIENGNEKEGGLGKFQAAWQPFIKDKMEN